MPNMTGKMCISHTATPAVTRCVMCFKPLCADCIVVSDGADTCSDECAQNYLNSASLRHDMERKEILKKKQALKRKIIRAIVLIIVAVAILVYLTKFRRPDLEKKAVDTANQLLQKHTGKNK